MQTIHMRHKHASSASSANMQAVQQWQCECYVTKYCEITKWNMWNTQIRCECECHQQRVVRVNAKYVTKHQSDTYEASLTHNEITYMTWAMRFDRLRMIKRLTWCRIGHASHLYMYNSNLRETGATMTHDWKKMSNATYATEVHVIWSSMNNCASTCDH